VSLAPGARLGPYEITAHLGAGGMGEVWRATDTNLGRQVAIKVLPDAVLNRFEELKRLAPSRWADDVTGWGDACAR